MARAEPPSGVAHLLALVGTRAAQRFADRLRPLGLSPAHVGVLRVVAQRPGLSQQALAGAIGVVPSKVVALVDDLEAGGLVRRTRSTDDRRNYELYLDEAAADALAEVRAVVRKHDAEVTAGLTKTERDQLLRLLRKLAVEQAPTPSSGRRSR